MAYGELAMSSTLYTLHRHRDISTVSGTGAVATICEFSSGLVAMHWDSPTPSVAVYTDIRHIEALHGHSGASVLEVQEPARLVKAYEQLVPWLLSASEDNRPMQVKRHPDWPDRLLATFRDERVWRFWVGLLDGSTYAATHESVRGQIVTTWVNPDGNLWLTYTVDGTYEDLLAGQTYDEDPLATFDREDRG
jgi:hypothetical protein